MIRSPIIYRGLFGSAGFQFLYASAPGFNLMVCTTLEYHVLLTLPLWVLSMTFHLLLPMAIANLLVSLGVCVAAGAQAALPRTKRRWWSRPLVGMLFFLQPIVRGWARYQGRLTLRSTPLAAQQTLESIALRNSKQSLHEVQYWSGQSVDRLAWIADALRRLDQQGWPNKSDTGWNDYDVEVYDTRWSRLQLTTVVEDHPQGKQLIRCRLRARWALRTKIVFWSMCGSELFFCGLLGPRLPWLWLLLLTLPLFTWLLHLEQRTLQSMIAVFLDDLAKEWNFTKVQSQSASPPPTQPSGAD
ncbi:MAG: hypothetical protein NT154_31650 [Verrucomicrobia bacterium]|nr:hypothetical protein [Verrucomicrobiota bacterium]